MPESPSFLLFTGFALGSATFWLWHTLKKGGFEKLGTAIIENAEKEALNLRQKEGIFLKELQIESQKEVETFLRQEKKKLFNEEDRLKSREDKLEARLTLVDKKLSEIEKREARLQSKTEQLEAEETLTKEARQNLNLELERLSCFSLQEAKDLILTRVEAELKQDIDRLVRKSVKETEEKADKEAGRIIVTAINRLAQATVSEHTIATVAIPNDEIKGRIIGREGRNIRCLEQVTGVNFIIDDTPGAVVLSCYDPVRRHVAKIALQELVADGRIHPTRIEEAAHKARQKVEKEIFENGEIAAIRAGVAGLHPEIITLLGKLSFRTSYGQNILEHSLEVSRLMGLMAGELGLDVKLAQRIGLLHDMGKALSHEVQGTHAVIGHDFALKYGENLSVANGIGCHHREMEAITVEGSLCAAADAISASRPGARIDAVEDYVKRIKKLEELAYEFPGVEKSYALQAGREIRVIVLPNMVDDVGMVNLARDLTKKIEATLDYPGKIKVTVIREKRAVEYAI